MKRAAICLLAVLLLFTACGRSEALPPSAICTGFSASADVVYRERNFGITLARPGPGACTIDFTRPETMNGMRIEFEGETMNLSYRGLSLSKDTDDSFRVGFAGVLSTVLDAACRADPQSVKEKGDRLLLEGSTEYGTYSLQFQKDGTLLSLEAPEEKLTLTFHDYEVMD